MKYTMVEITMLVISPRIAKNRPALGTISGASRRAECRKQRGRESQAQDHRFWPGYIEPSAFLSVRAIWHPVIPLAHNAMSA